MSKKSQISASSAQYGQIEYLLQLNLFASTPKVLSLSEVSNPHFQSHFERKCNQMSIIDTIILDNEIDSTEDEILQKGLPEMKVRIGKLKIDRSKSKWRGYVVKVGVGRSFAVDKKEIGKDVPFGYDSYHLIQNNEEGYSHEYFIKDPHQLLVTHIVEFEYDSDYEKQSREKPVCENCEKKPAVFFCSADNAKLCVECDKQLHTGKIAQKHSRSQIGKGADVFGPCQHHPDKLVEFFCSTCRIPVCVYCKMVGNHSSGESELHQLVGMNEAYQVIYSEITTPDNQLQHHQKTIQEHILQLKLRTKAVEAQAEQIQKHMEQIYMKALHQLKEIKESKLRAILSDEYESIRQDQEIRRLTGFIQYLQGGSVTNLLSSWSRHEQLKSTLKDSMIIRDVIDIFPDIKCSGQIEITTETVDEHKSPYYATMNKSQIKAFTEKRTSPSRASPIPNEWIKQSQISQLKGQSLAEKKIRASVLLFIYLGFVWRNTRITGRNGNGITSINF
eukprot:NODE_967_length_2698_cov_0.651404.p1 type:complete len:502 gc:universal NODE_967_length_2698_cov_0.651404:2216-711(-)